MQHQARKRFGQNFLIDQNIIAAISSAIAAKSGEKLVEIGPGLGALTKHLLESGADLTAIELDRDLIPKLQNQFEPFNNFTLINKDALKVNYSTLYPDVQSQRALRIVGNLPYNISTPLLFKLFESINCVADMFFMLQREVVERLIATPSSSDWGRLGIMAQYFCRVEKLLDVAPSAFSPQPKVNSAVAKFTPHVTPPYPVTNFFRFEEIVRKAFNMRRKTLKNSLSGLVSEKRMLDLDIDPQLRPENLTLSQFASLSNALPEEVGDNRSKL